MGGQDYQMRKRAEVQARLKLPPDQHLTQPQSGVVRALYDCPDLPLGPEGMRELLKTRNRTPTAGSALRPRVSRDGTSSANGGTGQQKSLCPGRLAASPGKTFPSSRMERCVVPPGSRW